MNSANEPKWLSEPEQQAWRTYLRASRRIEVALDRDLQQLGISLAEYEILSMVSESPGRRLRMSVLAHQVVQSRSRLTHTAKRLEARGWVTRMPVTDDRRGVELVLTEQGMEHLVEASRVHVNGVREYVFDVAGSAAMVALGGTLEDINTSLAERLGHHDGAREPR